MSFDKEYFRNYANLGPYDERKFAGFNKSVAQQIKKQLQPKTILDVGCARGFLVRALRAQGIDAYGIDSSEYAISHAVVESAPYCTRRTIVEPVPRRYELITCIEVLEHLSAPDAMRAIENMCAAADRVVFSSSANFIHPDATHINQHVPDYWIDLFARNGFAEDKTFEGSFICRGAMLFYRKHLAITFVLPGAALSGGVKVVLELSNRLVQNGHQVSIVSLSGGAPDWFSMRSEVRFICSAPERVAQQTPTGDVVIATLTDTAPLVYTLPEDRGQKYLFTQGFDPLLHPGMKWMSAFQLPMHKFTVSRWLQHTIEEMAHEQVALVSPGIDQEVFIADTQARQRYDPKSFRVGMIFSCAPFKGAADGLAAIRRVKKKHPNVKTILAGTQFRPRGVIAEEYWHAQDPRQMNQFYNSCDIFISSSWLEGFGLPSLEAMACKCAVACTDQRGNRDYAVHEQTALLSPIQRSDLLACNIIRLIEDGALRARLREQGYQTAKAFTWEETVRKLQGFIMVTYQLSRPIEAVVEKITREMIEVQGENRKLASQIEQMKLSTSWRITAPIRQLKDWTLRYGGQVKR